VAQGARLDYWFFRTSWESGALLVDVISRRWEGTVELRVSSWRQGTAQVNRLTRALPATPTSDPLEVVGCELTLRFSHGSCGPVSWDLLFDVTPTRLTAPPSPWRQMGAFDLPSQAGRSSLPPAT
jgi:hypothetical protein